MQIVAIGNCRRSDAARTNTTTASNAYNHKSSAFHHDVSSGSTPEAIKTAAVSAYRRF